MGSVKKVLIVIEGGEGSGKSSVISNLKQQGAFTTREPGGSQFSEKLRDFILNLPETKDADLTGLMLCMFGMRLDHISKTILPALNLDKTVVSDRFDGSTFAYQTNAENEFRFWELRKLITEYFDIHYIYLDIDPAVGLKRKKVQEELQIFEALGLEFHQNVRRRFLEFCSKVPSKVNIVDASAPLEELLTTCSKLVFR